MLGSDLLNLELVFFGDDPGLPDFPLMHSVLFSLLLDINIGVILLFLLTLVLLLLVLLLLDDLANHGLRLVTIVVIFMGHIMVHVRFINNVLGDDRLGVCVRVSRLASELVNFVLEFDVALTRVLDGLLLHLVLRRQHLVLRSQRHIDLRDLVELKLKLTVLLLELAKVLHEDLLLVIGRRTGRLIVDLGFEFSDSLSKLFVLLVELGDGLLVALNGLLVVRHLHVVCHLERVELAFDAHELVLETALLLEHLIL